MPFAVTTPEIPILPLFAFKFTVPASNVVLETTSPLCFELPIVTYFSAIAVNASSKVFLPFTEIISPKDLISADFAVAFSK